MISRVLEVVSKVELSASQQYDLANKTVERDVAIKSMLDVSIGLDSITRYVRKVDDQIYNLLTPTQKYDLFVAEKILNSRRKFTYSQFAIALRYRNDLELNTSQINALYKEVCDLKDMKDNFYGLNHYPLDTRAYESEVISEIITTGQYNQLLALKNKRKASDQALLIWKEIVDRDLVEYLKNNNQAKDDVITELTKYFSEKASSRDKYQYDLIAQKANDKEIYLNRPRILIFLQKIRKSPNNDTMLVNFLWN